MTRWRAWFQFRLLTLFAAISVIAIASTLYGVHLRQLQVQQAAFDRITAKGGFVHRYGGATVVTFVPRQTGGMDCFPPDQTYSPAVPMIPTFDDRDVMLLDGILALDSVSFSNSQVSKETIWQFAKAHPKCRVSY